MGTSRHPPYTCFDFNTPLFILSHRYSLILPIQMNRQNPHPFTIGVIIFSNIYHLHLLQSHIMHHQLLDFLIDVENTQIDGLLGVCIFTFLIRDFGLKFMSCALHLLHHHICNRKEKQYLHAHIGPDEPLPPASLPHVLRSSRPK